MAKQFAYASEGSLQNNVILNPTDTNDGININDSVIINNQSSNNQLQNCDVVAVKNDVQHHKCENIVRIQNNFISNNNHNNSPEGVHNIDDKYECLMHQASAVFQSNNNTNDIMTENDYAEIAKITRNFIPSHRIDGFNNFEALELLASVAARLQRLNDKKDDIENDNDGDSTEDYINDWDDIDEYQEFCDTLLTNAVNR